MTRCGRFCTAQVKNGAKTVAKVKITAASSKGARQNTGVAARKIQKQDTAQNVSSGILFCYSEIDKIYMRIEITLAPRNGKGKISGNQLGEWAGR